MSGVFTISLDFELHWGGFEKWPLPTYGDYFNNTRAAIPRMLELFARYDAHVTWAAVGILFHKNKQELIANFPPLKPSYRNVDLSAYNYIGTKGIGKDESDDPFHFAPSLVELIGSTPYQELGTHTFAHYYCNEDGQRPEQFRDDLRAAQRVAANFNHKLSSLVFPRNQFNDSYLRICFEEGIAAIRSNPLDWFWEIGSTEDESRWKRFNRGADAYLPVGSKTSYKLESIAIRQGLPLALPASRLLRPYRPSEMFLNTMKINRIRNEMETAARNGEVYHLWWHPHNFGWHPKESLLGLEKILEHFRYCSKTYAMTSLNMGETANLLLHGKK